MLQANYVQLHTFIAAAKGNRHHNKPTNHLADLMHHEALAMNSENDKLKSIPLEWLTNLSSTINVILTNHI